MITDDTRHTKVDGGKDHDNQTQWHTQKLERERKQTGFDLFIDSSADSGGYHALQKTSSEPRRDEAGRDQPE
jgi:hypothetical protein